MTTKRPNFLIILADDLGYSDVGCFGSEISTPVLDKLAAEGVRFTNFHTASACSPTRSMLLSGTDHHIAGIGAMIEHMNDDYARQTWGGKPGHEGYLLRKVAALPEVLQDAGYHTMISGKWHLGRSPDKIPAAWGFDRSYSFLHGCHNHYAWEPQFRENNKEDEFLRDFTAGMYHKVHMYSEGPEYVTPEPGFPKKPGGFYSTETFTDKLLDYLQERQAKPELKEKPFFAYYPFTAPHWPLQAPKEIRDRYKGKYDGGWHKLKEQRLKEQVKLGILDEKVVPRKMDNPFNMKDWDEMTDEERAKSSRAQETYAAMVELIDTHVGRVVEQLEKDGELDNTFILFMSDNGAEGASYEAFPFFGPQFLKVVNRYYNNDIENIGEPDSFVWYGNFWAQAATAPSRLYKMYTSQGGIRVPFILRYPPLQKAVNASPGSHHDPFCTVMDLFPTILQLADVPVPQGKFRDREVVPIRGKSWIDWFNGKEERIHDDGIPMGWELHGRAAMRVGDWKILFLQPPQGKGDWELFNVKEDPGETTDVADKYPEKFKELKEAWDNYVADTGVIWNAAAEGSHADGDETGDPKAWMAAGKRGFL